MAWTVGVLEDVRWHQQRQSYYAVLARLCAEFDLNEASIVQRLAAHHHEQSVLLLRRLEDPMREEVQWRCTQCGFVVDLRYEAEFPRSKT